MNAIVSANMKNNSALLLSASLVTTSYIPQGIFVYQLLNNGGLVWPMTWGNETIAWSAIFSLFAVLGLILAIKHFMSNPKGSISIVLFASIAIIFSVVSLVSSGVGAASKSDSEKLQLIEFWVSDWWK